MGTLQIRRHIRNVNIPDNKCRLQYLTPYIFFYLKQEAITRNFTHKVNNSLLTVGLLYVITVLANVCQPSPKIVNRFQIVHI